MNFNVLSVVALRHEHDYTDRETYSGGLQSLRLDLEDHQVHTRLPSHETYTPRCYLGRHLHRPPRQTSHRVVGDRLNPFVNDKGAGFWDNLLTE